MTEIDQNYLLQVIVEDKTARVHIHNRVEQDISNLKAEIEQACTLITNYIEADYSYQSKRDRVQHLAGMDIRAIVMELFILTISCNTQVPIQSICGQLAPYLGYDNIMDGVKTAAELVVVVTATDVYDVIPARDSESGFISVKSNYAFDESTNRYIEQTKYLPPMIVPPEKVVSNRGSGYLTILNDSLYLGRGNHKEHCEGYLDVINILNNTKLSLDEYMIEFEEESKKALDTPEKIKAFNLLKVTSLEVYEYLLNHGNEFYLTHKLDARLRVYCQGYHVSYQGAAYKKAIINTASKTVISDEIEV